CSLAALCCPSSPTRRSSDLYLRSRCFVVSADAQTSRVEGVSDDNIRPVIADAWFVGEWVRFRVTKVRVLPLPLLHTIQIRDKHRSEEHTSELQSRFDLVCRL